MPLPESVWLDSAPTWTPPLKGTTAGTLLQGITLASTKKNAERECGTHMLETTLLNSGTRNKLFGGQALIEKAHYCGEVSRHDT